MKNKRICMVAAFLVGASFVSGCASGGSSVYGNSPANNWFSDDQQLDVRYPIREDVAHMPFPDGAKKPLPRPAGEKWGVYKANGWRLSANEKMAERKSIRDDQPYAVVTPWGTVQ